MRIINGWNFRLRECCGPPRRAGATGGERGGCGSPRLLGREDDSVLRTMQRPAGRQATEIAETRGGPPLVWRAVGHVPSSCESLTWVVTPC